MINTRKISFINSTRGMKVIKQIEQFRNFQQSKFSSKFPKKEIVACYKIWINPELNSNKYHRIMNTKIYEKFKTKF